MTAYTSGNRAQLGLPLANHDKYPWAFSRHCSITDSDPWHNNRFAERSDGALLWFPRPEFDVPDNPILVAFRAENYGETASDWTDMLDRSWLYGIYGEDPKSPWTLAQIDHARRVLTKLANVYKEN